jgi:aryl-alcohol dehydrogenase-like predicted oxidoreductase
VDGRQPGSDLQPRGSRTVAQLEANLRAAARPLAADVMARLNAITQPLKERLGRSFDYYESSENNRTR